MRAYIDADVILDVLLGREDFVKESSIVLNLCENRTIIGHTTTLALANIYYIFRKIDNKKAKNGIKKLRIILKVLPITDNEFGLALDSKFKDFEDAVQNFAAEKGDCELIITRNVKDFKQSRIKAITPKELLMKT